MSTQLQVRQASEHDAERIAPLFDAYRVFYGQPSDLELARRFLHDRLTARESVVLYCCDAVPEAREVLGFAQLYPSFSSVSAARIWILNDLFVTPTGRRKGVARCLIEQTHAHARQTGAVRVVLTTAHTNLAAQTLYESIGYAMDQQFRSYSYNLARR